MIVLFLRGINTPYATVVSLGISLCEGVWNEISLVNYHDLVDLTILFLIKKIMNLSFVVVSQIVCHIL